MMFGMVFDVRPLIGGPNRTEHRTSGISNTNRTRTEHPNNVRHQRDKTIVPPLKNLKHEAFCRELLEGTKKGWNAAEAYRLVYGTEGHVSESAASRLLKNVEVQARIAELTEPAARKTRTTVDTLAAQLDEVFAGAAGDKQWGAAGSAAALKAKLLGFMRDKLEVGGPGSFDDLHTVEQVADRLIDDAGSPAAALAQLDQMRQLVEQRAAGAALDVMPTRWLSMTERRRRLD